MYLQNPMIYQDDHIQSVQKHEQCGFQHWFQKPPKFQVSSTTACTCRKNPMRYLDSRMIISNHFKTMANVVFGNSFISHPNFKSQAQLCVSAEPQ